ncbi:MAG: hypothetical protein ACOCYW_01455 [Roseicyclus sp.]
MIARRFFLRSLGAFAVLATAGGAYIGLTRTNAQREPFLIKPDGEDFAYEDGWVVKVDDVR